MAENKSKEERVSTIIDAAVEEFLEKGFEGASMNSIAAKAKLSKGGIYHHFKSKDEILLAASYRYMEPINEMIEKAKKEINPVNAIRDYIKDYLKHWSTHQIELQFTFLSLSKMIPQKELWFDISNYAKTMTSFFESLFIKGIMMGKFVKHDPKSRAVALFSALDGITAYLVMNENFTVENAVNNFEKVFISEILKQ